MSKPIKFKAGDMLTHADGTYYAAPTEGHYTVIGQIIAFNGTTLSIDWSGKAKNEPDAVAKAIEEIRARLGDDPT